MWCLSQFFFLSPAKAEVEVINDKNPPSSPNPRILASRERFLGAEIEIDGQKFPVAWHKWKENDKTYLGISDVAAMQVLGIELLNSTDPKLQSVRWFGESVKLKTKFRSPYRYLEVGTILIKAGWKIDFKGEILSFTPPVAQIRNITRSKQSWGEQTTVELDRASAWQLSQNGKQGVISLNAKADSNLLAKFKPQPVDPDSTTPIDEDDLGNDTNTDATRLQNLSLTAGDKGSKISLDYPAGNGIRVFTLNNPPRLLIENRGNSLVERDIQWHEGIRWRQRYISVNNSQFPVVYLEIDLTGGKLALKPITTNNNSLTGTSPLLTMARQQQAILAINGGYFNRNNQFPLGAIKKDDRWLSSPILNRGAIGWDDRGRVKIDRLTLQEVIVADTGNRIPLVSLNSGYLQGGIARYDRLWGQSYTTLTDNETILVVENNLAVEEIPASKAGEKTVAIPSNGYILAIRGNGVNKSDLSFGATLKLESRTVPPDFQQYSQIIGAGPLLLSNGKVVVDAELEKFNKAFGQQTASRSSIAVTKNGKLIVAAVHNRAGGKGATLNELALIMQNLGAVSALNLDGGSSTSLYLGGQLIDRSPVTAAKVHNGLGLFLAQ